MNQIHEIEILPYAVPHKAVAYAAEKLGYSGKRVSFTTKWVSGNRKAKRVAEWRVIANSATAICGQSVLVTDSNFTAYNAKKDEVWGRYMPLPLKPFGVREIWEKRGTLAKVVAPLGSAQCSFSRMPADFISFLESEASYVNLRSGTLIYPAESTEEPGIGSGVVSEFSPLSHLISAEEDESNLQSKVESLIDAELEYGKEALILYRREGASWLAEWEELSCSIVPEHLYLDGRLTRYSYFSGSSRIV